MATATVRAPRRRLLRSTPSLSLGPWTLTVPALAYVLAFFVVPLAILAVYSVMTAGLFAVSGPFTLENYTEALKSSIVVKLGRNAALTGFYTAVATTVIALPVAYWLRYSTSRLRLLVLFLITSSMFASYLVRIYAWRTMLGTDGLVNNGLEQLGIIHGPLSFLIYNRFAVVVALVHIFLPYVVLVLYAGFSPMRPEILDAAQDLGANAAYRWRRVVLPLIAAPATSGFIFVFILSAGDYVTPQFLGGTNGSMLGVLIQDNFLQQGNWAGGSAMSLLVLAAFVVCWAVCNRVLAVLRLNNVRFA